MRTSLVLAAAAVAVSSCQKETPPAAPPTPVVKPATPPAPEPKKVTLLITGHETGNLVELGPKLLTQWKQQEGWPAALAFSTGDTFSGAAISSHFEGKSTADVMHAMQYQASAFGNHDLDLGPEVFRNFRDASAVTFLAANLKDESDSPLKLVPYKVFTREGVKVGVIGFTSPKTVTTVVQGRAAGLSLIPLAEAFPAALEALAAEKPDVTLALVDDCFTVLKPLAEGKVDLVVGTRCDGTPEEDSSGSTAFFSVGDGLSKYVAARIDVRPDGSRVVKAERKEVGAKTVEEADLVTLRARWKEKLDKDLGEEIGLTRDGFREGDVKLLTMVATALRDETKADCALINKKGVRGAMPKGAVTPASIYNLMPFENAVLTVKVKGDALIALQKNPEAFLLAPKLDAKKDYVLATTDYLYFGGDGLGLEAAAPEPELNGMVWQTPVISWVRKLKAPIEKKLK